MRTICFVCTGNTCRSPMAEKLLVKKLKNLSIKEFSVTSCGVFANGENISDNAKEVLGQHGIKVRSRKSKKISKQMLKKNNVLFLTMTKDQKKYIASKNVYSIGEFVGGIDVIDPYNLGLDAYEETYKQLDNYTTIIAQKIKNII